MRPVRKVDNLTTFMCRLSWNLGASTSWNPLGLFRPVMGLLYLYIKDGDKWMWYIRDFHGRWLRMALYRTVTLFEVDGRFTSETLESLLCVELIKSRV